MRIYIAYKYRYITNKKALVEELSAVSDFLASLGYIPFILGRDIQKWQNELHSKISTLFAILRNIGRHDILFAYVNDDAHTNGLPVEFILAKLFGLKIVFARKETVKHSFFEKFADHKFTFKNTEDFKHKATQILANLN